MNRDGPTWRKAAFLLSAGAAAVHFGAAPGHFREWTPAGAFMLLSGTLQLAWGLAILRSSSAALLHAGVAMNAGVVALWVETRTFGLPFGPHQAPEHIHGADILATVLEIAVVFVGGAIVANRAAPDTLLRAALFGALVSPLARGDDPAHETIVAAATLLLAFAARSCLNALPASRKETSHEKAWIVAPGRPRRSGRIRAGFGASR